MKKLICHCGAIEAEINLDGDLAKVNAIVLFAKKRSNHVDGKK